MSVQTELLDSKPVKTIEEKWKLVPAFLKLHGLVKQHTESFNYFVNVDLQNIVDSDNIIYSDSDPNFYVKYEKIWVGEPNYEESAFEVVKITPQECRLRSITYAAPVYVNVQYTKGSQVIRSQNIQFCRLPIMLRSDKCVLAGKNETEMTKLDECPHDPGGYFVVRGTEKVILMQEQLFKNRVVIDFGKKGQLECGVTSYTSSVKSVTKVTQKDKKFFVQFRVFKDEIPISVVFRALGIEQDLNIAMFVGTTAKIQDALGPSLVHGHDIGVYTQKQALNYISKRSATTFCKGSLEDFIRDALAKSFLAHVPCDDYNYVDKAIYLGYMVRRLIQGNETKELTDRDYYGNKRIELAGSLMALLFEDLFRSHNFRLKMIFDKELSSTSAKKSLQVFDAGKYLRSKDVTQGLEFSIATGRWSLKRFRMERGGITQVLSRLSYVAAFGMMTRINPQFEKTSKVSGPRSLHPSHWGMVCPSDTPEGEGCGLTKNLALMSHVTTATEEGPIARLVYNLGVQDLKMMSGEEVCYPGVYMVLLNGNILGVTLKPNELVIDLRKFRRKGCIDQFLSISLDEIHKLVNLSCDSGRMCRPYIIVEKGDPLVTEKHIGELKENLLTFQDFIHQGIVEFLDVDEENDSLIAVYEADIEPETTHLEIEPFTLLGVCAGLVPYPHRNQSPRNTYQCAMGKQAMGFIAYNQRNRMDKLLYSLIYTHIPMVKTKTIELTNYDKLPAGHNATVAVMSYSGYDIEDALVINKASMDRGFGRCGMHTNIVTSLKRYSNQRFDVIMGPRVDESTGEPVSNHKALDANGIADVGQRVENGDVLVNKMSPKVTSGSEVEKVEYSPCAMSYKYPEPGYVEKIMLTSNKQEDCLMKILLRQTRRPELGDKFSSRHGQKGVVGLIAKQEDMPFNDQGICPDIIMNPHGFPSRMTVGKLLELLSGKAGVLSGTFQYGTAFGGSRLEDMQEILIKNGFNYQGKDMLTSGITGEPLEAYIYFGPIYYQKLKHMVVDKMHARATGPIDGLTRQPTEGRGRAGGLRLGEMERDCFVAYGVSGLLFERLLVSSDEHEIELCGICGLMSFSNWCHYCKSSRKISKIKIPYACKLMFQELISMNIIPRLELKNQI